MLMCILCLIGSHTPNFSRFTFHVSPHSQQKIFCHIRLLGDSVSLTYNRREKWNKTFLFHVLIS